ncbi:MAG: hypothetical protein Q8M08_01530 [Bacteroidales bacterium]|nr:hypothetical protein [Bacteroidales bacterium]
MKTIASLLKLSVLTLLILMSSGCKTYMYFKYGFTQPKEENPEKLFAFLEKRHFPCNNQYLFTDSSAYTKAIRNPLFRKYLFNHLIFRRDGTLLQRDTTQCQWSGYDKIASLDPDSTYDECNDLKLNQILQNIQSFGKNLYQNDVLSEPDFTIVVTWAKFLGTYNSRLFVLSEAVNLNQKSRIRLIWLNTDMQESWKLTKDQKLTLK